MRKTIATIIGSGTCVPSLKRSSCSILLEVGSSKLLFDSGPGTMHSLLRAGIEIFEINFICYSHFHPDHTGELVPFIFATKYPDSHRRKTPLTIVAGSGFNDFFDGLKAVYGEWLDLPPGILRFIELDNEAPDKRKFEDFNLTTRPMKHRPESIGFRITDTNGRSMVYSGDTDVNDNLVLLAKEADLLICESAMPDELRVPGHLTPSLVGNMATQAQVKQLILTHLYPECDQADLVAQCRKTYQGPVLVAEDLMKIEL
jgi:ribonuclease BN (tRNA processing enzyme)